MTNLVERLNPDPTRSRRHVWHRDGRAHIEVRGARSGANAGLVTSLRQRLERLDAVDWAAVDQLTGKVVLAFDDGELSLDEIIDIVAEVEEAHGTANEPFPDGGPDHPSDFEPIARELVALVADAAAMGIAFSTRIARAGPLPREVGAFASIAQSQAGVRRFLEGHLGKTAAHVGLAGTNALFHALGEGPVGLVADAGLRLALLGEASARRHAWEAQEERLYTPATARTGPAPVPKRPVPLPPGPVELYAKRAWFAGMTGSGIGAAATRNMRRGIAMFLSSTPKAAHDGKEAFAAHLGRAFAGRGILCFDRSVLRRLDRIDCLVLDGSATRGEPTLGRIVVLESDAGSERRAEITRAASDLIENGRRRRGPWARKVVRPRSALRQRLDVRRALRELGEPAEVVLHDGEPVAIVTVSVAPNPEVAELVAVARRAGWMVAVAGDAADLARVNGHLRVPGGASLVESIGMLQTDGCAVALVTDRPDEAVGLADCSIAVSESESSGPWAADLVCHSLLDACFVLEAAAVAHEVSRQSAALSLAGSSVAAIISVSVPVPGATARALTAINAAALAAQANALRAAIRVAHTPPPTVCDQVPWHELTEDEVLARTGSDAGGLPSSVADKRLTPGVRRERISFASAVVEDLSNPLTPVLAGAALLSSAVGSAVDAAIVGSVTALNGLLGGWQRWRVEAAVQALDEASSQRVLVHRDGDDVFLPVDRVVVGDVIALGAGDSVPADARVLTADGLEVDESSVTGESVPVSKGVEPVRTAVVADRSSMLYDGTTIAADRAEAVVVATGDDTEAGAALAESAERKPSGGVEARLAHLTRLTLPVSAAGGAAVTGLGLLRGRAVRDTLASGVSLAVAAVPEGLPLIATTAQVGAARRLAERGALVRNPRAIETLGRVDVLCADKTGTLTEGRIELHKVSNGVRAVGLDELAKADRYTVAVALRASPASDETLPHLTDRAVVEGAERVGVTVDEGEDWRRSTELLFEPARGYHAVLGATARGNVLSVKGAPEIVLPRCDSWRIDGDQRALDLDALHAEVDRLAREGHRVLAVAERPATSKRDLDDDRVARLTFVGFVALSDPVRPTAAAAVARLADAKVRTIMMTGDHPSTAEGIAAELGLLNGHAVITGAELDELDDAALGDAIERATVFARVTPSQKLRLVRQLRARGHVVAMTGDGANDAPSIRLADVGIALGEHSTSGARRAADLVVPGGRIETIVDAVVEGRAMWSSVREAVAILVGGNLGETLFTVGSSAVSTTPALSPRQLLLVNLLTDALPAMAVATRAPRDLSPEELLREGPDQSLGASLERAIVSRGLATATGASGAWALARLSGRQQRASTVALAALVGGQLAQTLAAGATDPMVLGASLGSAAALIAIIQTPGLSQLFGCTPLGPAAWSMAAGGTALSLVTAAVAPPIVDRAFRTSRADV